ncbi:hypothetical protein [Novimethylophilus kurashikiensis]|nr:hypothetical protein [Novimethylophilus kurashikiensis]
MHTSPVKHFTHHGEPFAIDVLLSNDTTGFAESFEHVGADIDSDETHLLAQGSGVDDDISLDDEELVQEERPQPGRRVRSAPVQVRELAEGEVVSVYTRLVDYGLLKKLTDIVLAKVSVPWHLRDDAAQEVHAAWAALTAKPNFQRNQLARYAYMSGQHAALKLRRNIGAVVAIPGALFRTGRDSSFMEAIGAAVNPKDVDDFKDSLELSVEPEDYSQLPQQVTPDYFRVRIEGLPLSKSQRAVAERVLVRRMNVDSIATELNVRPTYVERLIAQVTQMLNSRDDQVLGNASAARKKSKKAAGMVGIKGE